MKNLILSLLLCGLAPFSAHAAGPDTLPEMTAEEARMILQIPEDISAENLRKAAIARVLHENNTNTEGADSEAHKIRLSLILQAFDTLNANSNGQPALLQMLVASGRPGVGVDGQLEGRFRFFKGYGGGGAEDWGPLSHNGLHTETILKDFNLAEMENRSGNYGAFYNELYPRLVNQIGVLGNPYYKRLATMGQVQAVIFKRIFNRKFSDDDLKIKLFYLIFAGGPALIEPNLLWGTAVLHGLVTAIQVNGKYSGTKRAKKEFNAMIKEMSEASPGDKKAYLLAYDIVETIAYTQIETPIGKPLYFKQFLTLMGDFPFAFPGFIMRMQKGLGLAGQLKGEFEKDLQKRPDFWKEQFGLIENNGPKKEDPIDCLRLLLGKAGTGGI